MDRTVESILDDPDVTMYRARSDTDGPSVAVVAGIHGNEVTTWQAARLIRLWSITKGDLRVIPQANPRACAAETRRAEGEPDLNRQFPSGTKPTHPLARSIWSAIEDADYIFDLHRSKGLYKRSPSGVGQAIFPTPAGRDEAVDAIKHLNSDHVPSDKQSTHAYRVGNDQEGYNDLLSHKVGGDLDPETVGWLVETTYHEQDTYTQIDQLEHAVSSLLWHATDGGFRVTDHGHSEQDPDPEIVAAYDESGEPSLSEKQQVVQEVIETLEAEYGLMSAR